MNRAELKARAREQIQGKIWIIFAINLVVAIAAGALSSFSAGLGQLLIMGSVMISLSMIYLNIVRKDKMPVFEDLFTGFQGNNFGRGFLGYILMSIYTFLWSLLLVIPGIIKGLAYSQMFYILADDKKISAPDALKKSMAMMEGHKWEAFVLGLSFFGWVLLICITFGIAAIWVGPYMQATMANYYVYLKELYEGKEEIAEEVEVVVEE